jgi:very-long-chain enoyl-CoA reductase
VAQLVFMLVVGLRLAGGAAQRALPIAVSVGIGMWCLHFARRASEAAFIHRYGKPQVPLADVLTEYVYYWGFAVWNALSLLSESYRGPALGWVLTGAAVFVLAELGNAKAHRMLRDLRPAGTAARVIPRGFLFERVSSPHYLFEILTWVGFALATQTWAALAFLLLGSGILASWARARHLAYRKDFDGLEGRASYPAARRALIPGVF